MASQKITRLPSRPIGQIPAATFDTGAASTALGLANMFDGLAAKFADQEDRVAVAKAKRLGAVAGSQGAFVRQDEATLVGEAFNAAALHTFTKTTSAKILAKQAELEQEHRGNVLDFNDAFSAYKTGILKEIETVDPSLVPAARASMGLQQRQGEARIVKTMRSAMKDRATASTLTIARAIQERIADEAAKLDTGDGNEMAAFVGTLAQSRAQLNAAYSGLGPNGLPLFTEEAKTAALLAFDDWAATNLAMAGFNAALAAEQSGTPGEMTTLDILNKFRAGNAVQFSITDGDGNTTTHSIVIRDELREKIATRMRSSMKAARAETNFKRATEDRERTKLQTSANAALDLGIVRGEINENDVEEQHARGFISDRQRADRLIQIERRDDDNRDRQRENERVGASLDGGLDPNDPDDRKAIDNYWEDVIAPTIEAADPEAKIPMIMDFVKRTGTVPRPVKNMIHGALRQGPAGDAENAEEIDANKLQAADMMGRLRDAVPTVMNEFTADEKNFGIHIQTLIEAGVPGDQAVRRAEEMRDVPPAVKEFRAKQVTTDDHFNLNADFVDDEFEDDGTFAFGFGTDDTLAGAAFRAEFNEMQGRNFMRTGDLEASQNTAAADIRRVWASSAVGNAGDDTPRMMKYAPERFGPFPRAADNTEWLQNQFEKDMNALGKSIGMTETIEAETEAMALADTALGETTTATTPRRIADQFRIETDFITAREASDPPPSYFVQVLNKDGAWVEARDADGDLVRWQPDWSASDEKAQADAESAEALARARLAIEQNNALNAEIDRQLPLIRRPANPTQAGRELDLPTGVR